jgi:tetratricopeptide (TPR) repeat protein
VPGAPAGAPAPQAELFGVLARAERSLGDYASALARAREAQRRSAALYGAGDPRVAEAAATVAGVLADQGQLEEAERHARAALAALDDEGAEGELAAARLEAALGGALHQQWRLDDAEETLRRVVARREERLGRRHPETVAALLALAAVVGDAEEFEEAERLHRETLELARAVHGPAHPAVAAAEASYATMLDTLKRFDEAERRYLAALAIRRRAHGTEEHVAIAGLHQMLGILYRRTGRLDLAEREAGVALDLYRRVDPGHYEVANSLGTLGMVAWSRGDYRRARERMREALDATVAAEGESSFAAHVRRGNLAAVEAELGDFAAAERLAAAAIAGYEAAGESRSSYVSNTLVVHGAIARGAGRHEEALERHRLARAIRVELYGEGHVEVDGADLEIALDLLDRDGRGDREEARRILEPALDRCRRAAATTDRCESIALAGARLLARERGAAAALPALREACARIARSRGAAHPVAAEARAHLAEALLAAGTPELRREGRAELTEAVRLLAAARGSGHPLVARLERSVPGR